jgi:hypothetical protein
MPDWAWRRCPRCHRTAYVPAAAFCTFHANQRFAMETIPVSRKQPGG